MTWITCHRCATKYVLPDELYAAAKKSEAVSFWCPYGHAAHFPAGETEADKLRRERDRLAQSIAWKDDMLKEARDRRDAAERRAAAARGQVTKIKNRVGRGVCPCCNRTFDNLHRHMTTQHPTFIAEAAE